MARRVWQATAIFADVDFVCFPTVMDGAAVDAHALLQVNKIMSDTNIRSASCVKRGEAR